MIDVKRLAEIRDRKSQIRHYEKRKRLNYVGEVAFNAAKEKGAAEQSKDREVVPALLAPAIRKLGLIATTS
jgi:hypothetical protein